jgi:hypothetical protein
VYSVARIVIWSSGTVEPSLIRMTACVDAGNITLACRTPSVSIMGDPWATWMSALPVSIVVATLSSATIAIVGTVAERSQATSSVR